MMTQPAQPISGILTEMTIDEVRRLDANVVVLPMGSTEPHGPHLPYGTDTWQVEAVARQAVIRANELGARALMYPTLPVGNNVNFKAFPMACRVSVTTLMQVILDIIAQLEEDGIRRIIILNGHGGNPEAIHAAIRQHMHLHRPGQGAFVCATTAGKWVPQTRKGMIVHPSDHAGEDETSRMLHLRPELVKREHFDDFPIRKPTLQALAENKAYYVRPWHGYIPASAGGQTSESSAEKGRILTEEGAQGLAQFILELGNAPLSDVFPYEPRQQDGPPQA